MKHKALRTFVTGMMSVSLLLSTCCTAMAAGASKEETVYVKINEKGEVTSVVVSDQLRNISGISEIFDISNLDDITNVKGDESFEKDGERLTWKNGENGEIVYQGTTDKPLPVGIELSYELDGKQITPDALKGKSGHLKIHVDYKNHTDGDDYVPFLMLTAFVADQQGFTNISADHGRVFSDGDRQAVIGYGVPGIQAFLDNGGNWNDRELLDHEELEIPEGFTLEADISDYAGITCMSIAVNDVFGEGDMDTQASMDKVKNSMNELTDAAMKLADGSAALASGTKKLKNASQELVDGVKKLDDGSSALAEGTGNLLDGTATLKDGAASLADGTAKLSEGSKALSTGAEALSAGASDAKSGADALKDGINQGKQGVSALKEQATDGLTQLSNGVAAISGGICQVHDGASQLEAGIGAAETGAGNIAAGISSAKTGADQLSQGIESFTQGAGSLSSLANAITAAIPATASGNADVDVTVDNSDIRTAVAETLRANGVDDGVIDQALAAIGNKTVTQTVTVTLDVTADTSAIGAYAQQLSGAASEVSAGAESLNSGAAKLSSGLAELDTGASALTESMGQLKTGAGNIVAATAEEGALPQACGLVQSGLKDMGIALNEGTGQLIDGLDQLHTGAGSLSDGLLALETGAGQLKDGAEDLSAGLETADSGAKQLAKGSDALLSGASSLNDGASELNKGLDALYGGSGKLAEGANELNDGANELSSGMQKFNSEGITKLNDLLCNDLNQLLDRVNLLRKNAADYNNCTGISEDMDGSVKFVFIAE